MVRKRVQEEWDEIVAVARHEVLSEMPDTLEKFVEMIESGSVPIEALVELGGVRCDSGSATIINDRITEVLKEPHSVWTMTIEHPNNDFLKNRLQLQMFRKEFRKLLNRIKAKHGESSVIHLFTAVPVSPTLRAE